MRILQLTAALLFATATACVTDEGREDAEESLDWRSGDGKQDGQTCEFDAMSAATYYKQFAYSKLENTSGSWYRVGLTWDIQPTLSNGDRGTMRLYFLANDRVIAEYSELRRASSDSSTVLNSTVVVTRATYDAATRAITIAGIGKGTPVTLRNSSSECAPGIAFEYTTDIRTAGLAGKTTSIYNGWTSARVIDPDNLAELPETMRKWFQEDVASGKILVIRK